MASGSRPPARPLSLIEEFQKIAASIEKATADNLKASVSVAAQVCILRTACLIDAAHGRLGQLDEQMIQDCMADLSIHRRQESVFSAMEPELLLTNVGPATLAGITRRTAHSVAFAVAEMVYQAVWKASNPSAEPPQVIIPHEEPQGGRNRAPVGDTPRAIGGDPGAFASFYPAGPKLSWDVPAIERRLQHIEPFDAVLLCEMVRQEAAQMEQIREARREADDHATALATIDKLHRTSLTKTQVAEKCGVTARTVDRWIKSGKLKCAVAEGKLVFDVREIEVRSARKKEKRTGEE